MFESTVPFGEPELMRASGYERYLQEQQSRAEREGISSRISSLSPSLRADLYRFEVDGGSSEVLEVVAACVRHAKSVTIHLQSENRVVPLTVFPHDGLVHCPLPMPELLGDRIAGLRVLHVEPALLRPPGDPQQALVGELRMHYALAPVLWMLALRGTRSELLPEIAGPAVYRVTPGLDLHGLELTGALLSVVLRLRRESTNLRGIAEWPGMDRDRAVRLLNALYLQAGLILSRSHPDAVGDGWFGARSR